MPIVTEETVIHDEVRDYLDYADTGCEAAESCLACPFTYCLYDGHGDGNAAGNKDILNGIRRNWKAGDRDHRLTSVYISGGGGIRTMPVDVARSYLEHEGLYVPPPQYNSASRWSLTEKALLAAAIAKRIPASIVSHALGRPEKNLHRIAASASAMGSATALGGIA